MLFKIPQSYVPIKGYKGESICIALSNDAETSSIISHVTYKPKEVVQINKIVCHCQAFWGKIIQSLSGYVAREVAIFSFLNVHLLTRRF